MNTNDFNVKYKSIIEKYADILINKMVKATLRQNEDEIVTYIKQIVPEFKSSNSVFEKLDK